MSRRPAPAADPTGASLDAFIARALEEDVGEGDITTEATIPAEAAAEARFLAKEAGVLAGLVVAERILARVDSGLVVRWTQADGDRVEPGAVFGEVRGRARGILTAERLALNVLQRMSGIATATRRMVEAVGPYPARILDTRKTAPGLRGLDKWAVRIGGGLNHRHGLYDMVLIKDNHIAAAGGVRRAIEAARSHLARHDLDLEIEVETRTMDELREVLETGGIDRVLLDNLVHLRADGTVDTSALLEAVRLIEGRIATEVSGNVTLATVRAIAATGVDYISSGALTHSVRALDLSLKIVLREG